MGTLRKDYHSIFMLTWDSSWTEEPGRLQSMGVTRVGYDLVTKPPSIHK